MRRKEGEGELEETVSMMFCSVGQRREQQVPKLQKEDRKEKENCFMYGRIIISSLLLFSKLLVGKEWKQEEITIRKNTQIPDLWRVCKLRL